MELGMLYAYPKKINLGSGPEYIKGYLGLDRKKWNEHVNIICDLDKNKLPFKNNSVDEILAKHVLEHLKDPDLIIAECYRSLKVGGLLHIVVPHYSLPQANVPVHRNYWSIGAKILFDGGYHEFGKWSKVEWDINFANQNGLKQKILKPLIKKYPSIYEGHFAAIMPIADLHFKLIK